MVANGNAGWVEPPLKAGHKFEVSLGFSSSKELPDTRYLVAGEPSADCWPIKVLPLLLVKYFLRRAPVMRRTQPSRALEIKDES